MQRFPMITANDKPKESSANWVTGEYEKKAYIRKAHGGDVAGRFPLPQRCQTRTSPRDIESEKNTQEKGNKIGMVEA